MLFFWRKKDNFMRKIHPNQSYGSPDIKETVKGRIRERRNREIDPISEGLSPLPRHGDQGPEGKPFSHLGRRSRKKKKKKGGPLPLASGGAGALPGPSSSATTLLPSTLTFSPSMQRCKRSFTRCNLYLNMVLNAIYYFPMMYGYPMMFE